MKKHYKSEALMVIHQSMEAVYRLGAVTPEEMSEFDAACLVPETAPGVSAFAAASGTPHQQAGIDYHF